MDDRVSNKGALGCRACSVLVYTRVNHRVTRHFCPAGASFLLSLWQVIEEMQFDMEAGHTACVSSLSSSYEFSER